MCQGVTQFSSVALIPSVWFLAFFPCIRISACLGCISLMYSDYEQSILFYRRSGKSYEGTLTLAEEGQATTNAGVYEFDQPAFRGNRYNRVCTWKWSNLKNVDRGGEHCRRTDGSRWWDNREGSTDVACQVWHPRQPSGGRQSYCQMIRDANKKKD